MTTFFIETDLEGKPLHDFSFHLVQAVAFHEWKYGRKSFAIQYSFGDETDRADGGDVAKIADVANKIPIGSLPFVFKHLNNVNKVTPLNVPDILNVEQFTGRTYQKNMRKIEMEAYELPLFVKESAQYKGITDIISSKEDVEKLPDVDYDISEVIDIQSEWRVFVQMDEVVGVKHYGTEHVFPLLVDKEQVLDMVKTIEQARYDGHAFPLSYTLDIAVNESGSFLIEAHPFVSCGLYGFADYQRLPSMMIQGYRYMQQQAGLLS